MEPLAKRQGLSYSPWSQQQDDDDELNFEPEEVDNQRDPGQQLQESRAFAAYKLKSTFEHIFEKYERDFTGIGDEIDLRTGEIVVDNGHIQRLGLDGEDGYQEEDEGMLLEDAFPGSDEEDDREEELGFSRELLPSGPQRRDEDEEDRILQGRPPPTEEPPSSPLQLIATPALQRRNPLGLSTPGRVGADHRLSSLAFSRHAPARSSPLSFGAWGPDQGAVDPIWRTPQLSSPQFGDTLTSKLYGTRYNFPAAENQQSIWSLPPSDMSWPSSPYRPAASPSNRHCKGRLKPVQAEPRKLLLAPQDEDDEDEILSRGVTRMEALSSRAPKALPAPPTNQEANGLALTKQQTTTENVQSQPGKPAPKRKKAVSSGRGIRPEGRPSSKTAIPGVKVGSRTNIASQHQPATIGDASVRNSRGRSPKGSAEYEAATPSAKRRRRRTKATALHEPVQPTALHIAHQETLLVLDDELPQGPSIHRLVIELPRRPEPAGLTEVCEILSKSPPRSTEMKFTSTTPLDEAMEPCSRPERAELVIPDSQELSSFSSSATTTEPAAEEEPQSVVQKPSIEKFRRNEVDPSYEFSDEETGIPVARGAAAPVPKRPETFANAVEPSGLPKRVSARLSTATAAPEGTLVPIQQQYRGSSEVLCLNADEHTRVSGEEKRADKRVPQEIQVHKPKVFVLPGTTGQAGDLAETKSRCDRGSKISHDILSETAARELSFDMAMAFSDGDSGHTPEQPEIAIAGDSVPGLSTDDDGQAEPQQPPGDGELPKEAANAEVPDSNGSDDLSEESFQEVLELLASTPDTRPEAQSHVLQPMSENIPRSPLLNQTRRALRRKAKLSHEAPISMIEEEHHTASIPPSTPRPARETETIELDSPRQFASTSPPQIEVIELDSPKKRPSTSSNPKPKKQKKDIRLSTPQAQMETTNKASSRRSILSLRPEDADEDEISLVLNSWSASRTDHALPPRTVGFSSVRRNTLAKLAGSSPLRGRSSVMSSMGIAASGSSSGGLRFRTAREGFGGMSTPTKRRRDVPPRSPEGSLIQTPGGRMRRCGVDGFSCDRDFCFTCLRG